MNERRNLIFGGIGILCRQIEEETFIGKRMIVQDNSYITTKGEVECGGLYGKVVELISEPYEAAVKTCLGDRIKKTCVKVRSIETGIEYRTLFRDDWICENHDTQKYGVRGRYIKLSDRSYSKEINGEGRIHGYEEIPMIIITEPFVDTIEVVPNTYKDYLCVIAKDLRSGKNYRILFNEEDLQEESPIIEITINVTIEIK
jgi:hypothetical protein